MTKTWWEAPMGGSVLSFLKAEWKVSDTGSAHWASSFIICRYLNLVKNQRMILLQLENSQVVTILKFCTDYGIIIFSIELNMKGEICKNICF
jgi:hypothetical protein